MLILADLNQVRVLVHHYGQFVQAVVQTQHQVQVSRQWLCVDTTGERGTGRAQVTGDRTINVRQGSKDGNRAVWNQQVKRSEF